MLATSIFSLLLEYDISQLSVELAEGKYTPLSVVISKIPCHRHLKVIPKKKGLLNNFFKTFLTCSLPISVSKKTKKKS